MQDKREPRADDVDFAWSLRDGLVALLVFTGLIAAIILSMNGGL